MSGLDEIRFPRDTYARLASWNRVYDDSEPIFEADTRRWKIGDGKTAYVDLQYVKGDPAELAALEVYVDEKTGRYFKDVADFSADTKLTYEENEPGSIVTGDPVRIESQFADIAASGAGDGHYTTAEGVEAYEAGPNFSTRARMVAWFARRNSASRDVPVGTIVTDDQGLYQFFDNGETNIAGMTGWRDVTQVHTAEGNVRRHGAPTADLIRTGADTFVKYARESATILAGAADGEGYAASDNGGWPLSDGATQGGPEILAANADGGLNMLRLANVAGYTASPQKLSILESAAWSFSPAVRRVVAIVYSGQSQAVTISHNVLTSAPPNANRLGMFAGGARPGLQNPSGIDKENYLFTAAALGGIVPLKEQLDSTASSAGESPMSALCNNILASYGSDVGILAINSAVASQTVENLSQGKASWHNIALALGVARYMCEMRGVTFDVGALFWSQGGANVNDTPAEYQTKFNTGIYDPWNALCVSHGFAAHSRPVFLSQMTHNTGDDDMGVARAAQLMHDDATRYIRCVGPEYLFTSVNDEGIGDGSTTYTAHISAEGVNHRAYFEAEAYVTEVIDGNDWEPLRIQSAVRSGATVTLTLNTGDATITTPILSNSAAITAVANAGFSWQDDGDGNSVTISSVTVNGSNQIVITLSATPTGSNQKIGYALGGTKVQASWQGPVNGARGSVCDSTTGTLTINSKSYTPRNHLLVDLFDVTT